MWAILSLQSVVFVAMANAVGIGGVLLLIVMLDARARP